MRLQFLIAACLTCWMWPLHSQAQPGSVDLMFDPGSATDGSVNAITIQADGKILIAGDFTVAESGVRGRIARLHPDGTLDTSFGAGLAGADRVVHSVVLQNDGKVLIGGEFTNVNGIARSGIARLNTDGTLDTSFGLDGSGIRGLLYNISGQIVLPIVRSVAVQIDGKVLIAGNFTNVNGASRENIARLNTDGSLDTNFAARSLGQVHSVAVQSDGKLVLGGAFTRVNDVWRYYAARLNSDGSLDTNFLNSSQHEISGGYVHVVAVQSDGKIILGGDFTQFHLSNPFFQSVTRNHIARLNPNGSLDTSFGNGLAGADSAVRMLLVQPDGNVLIGGDFSSVNGVACTRIARLTPGGSLDNTFQNGITAIGFPVACMAQQSDGKILVGGGFSIVNGATRHGVARLNADGSLDTNFGARPVGLDGGINVVKPLGDGKVLIGGSFTRVNGTSRNNLARFNSDGSLDSAFGAGLTGVQEGYVRAIAFQSDGKLLIGGNFAQVNGAARYGIARLYADGSLDTSFSAALSGSGDWVRSIAVEDSGKIIIGGHFGWVNGVLRPNIARLNSDGSLDANYASGTDVSGGGIRSIALQADGKWVIGGDFTGVNGISRRAIARLNSNGTADESFGLGQTGVSYSVYAVAIQSDGKILIGGGFVRVNGSPRQGIARLNADGSLDEGFGAGLTDYGYVYSLALQPDGKILMGGDFKSVNGAPRGGIARFNADGSLDINFANGLGAVGINPSVHSVAFHNDGVVLGGAFTGMHEFGRARVARLHGDHPPLSISRSGPGSVLLSWPSGWSGYVPEEKFSFDSTWTNVLQAVSDNGTNRFISVPATNDVRFYRLSK